MKKIIGLLSIMMLFIAFNVQAQTQTPPTPNPNDPTTYLTEEGRIQWRNDLMMKEWERKLETYGKWVGVGGEIGNAMREALEALGDFSETEIGKFTMYLVAWKVIGKDLVRIVLGLIFIAIFTWLIIFSFKRTCIERRILVKNSNPGFMRFPKVKEYEIIEPRFGDGEGLGIIRIAHILFFFIGIWVTYGIMFAG